MDCREESFHRDVQDLKKDIISLCDVHKQMSAALDQAESKEAKLYEKVHKLLNNKGSLRKKRTKQAERIKRLESRLHGRDLMLAKQQKLNKMLLHQQHCYEEEKLQFNATVKLLQAESVKEKKQPVKMFDEQKALGVMTNANFNKPIAIGEMIKDQVDVQNKID